jgi:glutamate---cysteine ligase / carboxylate-amine ligase
MNHAFGNTAPFTVGIEEELFLVDGKDLRLAPAAGELLSRIDEPPERIGHEAYASQLELRSPPSTSAAEAAATVGRLRGVARSAGATLVGAGLHPGAAFGEVELVDSERYRTVRAEMRGLIERTPEAALHVHVGMPDAEAAIRAHNALRSWLPMLAGLAATSPYWFGLDSDLASARRAVISAFPGRGMPDPIADLADYEQRLATVAAGGGPSDYTLVWWDIRLHPALGTVELREMDAQSRLGDVAAIGAMVRGLARDAAEREEEPVPREALEWSMFRAIRDGTGAEILDQGRLVPLQEAARRAIRLAEPHAREVGDGEALAGIERILDDPSPARQRRAFAERGIGAVLELLREETDGD